MTKWYKALNSIWLVKENKMIDDKTVVSSDPEAGPGNDMPKEAFE